LATLLQNRGRKRRSRFTVAVSRPTAATAKKRGKKCDPWRPFMREKGREGDKTGPSIYKRRRVEKKGRKKKRMDLSFP